MHAPDITCLYSYGARAIAILSSSCVHSISALPARQKSTVQKTWEHKRTELCNGILDHGKAIPKNRVKFVLPVCCKRRKDPVVYLWVIPCENEQSRSVTVEGELIIKTGCSQHRWLVEYCRCSVRVNVKVFDSLTNRELGNADSEFMIEHSGLNRDHRTSIELRNVLDHQLFLYNNRLATYTFKAEVQLMEHEVTLGPPPRYECRESMILETYEYVDIVPEDALTVQHDDGNRDAENQQT